MSRYFIFIYLLLFPALLFAQDLSLSSFYQINGFGGELFLKNPSSFFYDGFKERILVANTGANEVDVFTLSGKPLFRIGEKGELSLPVSIAAISSGKVLILEQKSLILKVYDEETRQIVPLNLAKTDSTKKIYITQIYSDKMENLYLVDSENNCILVLDKNFKLEVRIGSSGRSEGKFQRITSLAVDNAGRIFAADAQNYPLQVFDRDGKYLFRFEKSNVTQNRFLKPACIFFDLQNRLWVIDADQSAILVYDANGNLLQKIDSADQGKKRFFFPIQLAVDKYGLLYLLEKGKNQIEVFKIENF